MKYPSISSICLSSILVAACGGGSSGSSAVPAPPVSQSGDNVSGDPVSTALNLGSTSQAVIDQCMSAADKEMLTRVNLARSQARNCGSGSFPATAALSWNCTVETVALEHSRDMGDNNFFSHTGSDGLDTGNRLTNAGYDWFGWSENIAAGQPTIEAVVTGWLNSAGHCANIMNASVTEFGAAVYFVVGSDYPNYWTQVFAAPRT